MTATSTATDITAPEIELAAMQEAIADAWAGSLTPTSLRDACLDFCRDRRSQVQQLRAILLVTLGAWIKECEGAGNDRHVLEQVAAAEAYAAIAMMMRAAKERRGEPFIPARTAIVAFAMASNVARAEPFHCDLDGAVAAFEQSIDADDSEAAHADT